MSIGHFIFILLILCILNVRDIKTGDLLSSNSIRQLIKNTYVLNKPKNLYHFTFFYLYNTLKCTLTGKVFEIYEDEKYEKEIFLIKKNLENLKKQKENKNLWVFFEFNLFDSLLSSIEEIESNMKKFDIGLLEIYKELKLSDRRFKEVTKYELNICKEEIIFDVEEIGLLLSIVPYALETLEISQKNYLREFHYILEKTLNFFNIFMSLINEHNVNIIDIDKKEINLFLKVKDSFDFIRSNEENLFSLHDEIVLKNKYGQILIKDLFLLFKKIFFIEVDENLIYFNYIDIIPIYIKTKNGLLKSRYYNMENYFYALIENTYKQNLQINEGIILIKILKQYKIHSDTKLAYYFDSDIIYKTILHQIYKQTSHISNINFDFLYSQNIDSTNNLLTENDVSLSLIILINSDVDTDKLTEQFYRFSFPKDIFRGNEDINKQRIKVMGSCVYTKESQTPIFNGFFSLGLSTYNLFKIIELLKPNKKLLYLSLEKAHDNNQIRAQAIAERIVMNSKELFETVLLFERDVRNI
ncbi:hypothetical protein PFMALIP_03014 [Plasmodium falciparum MaliPS096_E11]|uniref:Uncharacterized protein n=1 Tax=Plasmodium falciparum MaliPS096_E11 TaxID=1036727 RepID=A0A024WNT5_PLAFA|nr:hypothetical protein PFMALIP_03014 [Plasmodium falciparum MaliPS096_E11]